MCMHVYVFVRTIWKIEHKTDNRTLLSLRMEGGVGEIMSSSTLAQILCKVYPRKLNMTSCIAVSHW